MEKIKIHELSKKINLTSKEVVEKAKELGIEAKSHLSSISTSDAKKIEKAIGAKESKEVKPKTKKKAENKVDIKTDKKEEAKSKEEEHVIIRRKVIIAEEEPKKEAVIKKETKEDKAAFIEKNRNKDFNIVYREKPQKPLTASELFGIKSKEKPVIKEEIVVKEKAPIKEASIVEPIKEEEKPKTGYQGTKPQTIGYQGTKPQGNTGYQGTKPQNTGGYQGNNNRSQGTGGYQGNNNRPQGTGGYQGNNNRPQGTGGYQGNNNRPQGSGGYQGNNNRPQGTGGYQGNNNRPQGTGGYQGNNNRPQGTGGYQGNNNRSQGYGGYQGGKKFEKDAPETIEKELLGKENVRTSYANRFIDKAKNEKYEQAKAKKPVKRGKGVEDEIDENKLQRLKHENKLSSMLNDPNGGMLDYYDLSGRKRRGNKRRNQLSQSKQQIFELKEIKIPETVNVKNFAAEMKKTASEVIKKLLNYGVIATLNNDIDFDTAYLIAEEFGIKAIKKEIVTDEEILFDDSEDKDDNLVTRPPVVVVMGHVDHGKTSTLDAIRSANVIEGEAGGITQHIGAYKVEINNREITFLDTPGHEAFTSMRARGAKVTDIAILVVAANDGIMPQTIEAINHAKAAEIPIIVAINKIDLEGANVEKIKQDLTEYELVSEDWGGDTIIVPISAKKNENIDTLLEMVLLVADMQELKSNPDKQAKGTIIEAKVDKGTGTVATLLVQRGTLKVGDTVVVGSIIGRVRSMIDDKGKKIKSAGPSTPVEITGLPTAPEAGDIFYEVKDEKTAKHLIEKRKTSKREKELGENNKVTLEDLFSQIEEGKLKQLNLIVKADVQGSVEAVKQSLEKLSNEEVRVKVIHANVGAVSQSDVTLAKVSNAIIIAFNVRPEVIAKGMAEKEEVEIKTYSVIYHAIEDIESAMKGMLDPVFEEKVIGNVEVRQTFKVSNVGTIAGAYVLEGKITRNSKVRVIRDNVVIHDGELLSLKRFKDDAKEIAKGYECGVQIKDYDDILEGDILESYIMEEVKPK